MGADRIPDDVRRQVETAADRADERTSLSALHTVVALAGVTGGGKSSIFNAFAGGDVAETGVRRPITYQTQAAVWGSELAGDLLDWLDVPASPCRPAPDDPPPASCCSICRTSISRHDECAEADRILERADLFVWVTDPRSTPTPCTTTTWLPARLPANRPWWCQPQDTVAPDDAWAIMDLLRPGRRRRNPRGPHLGDHRRGSDELRPSAEVVGAATPRVPSRATCGRQRGRSADGCGRDPVLGQDTGTAHRSASGRRRRGCRPDAVEADHRRRALGHTGWCSHVGSGTFALIRSAGTKLPGAAGGTDEARRELEMLVARTSLPEPTPAARAAVDLAVRRVGETGAEGLPHRWADAVRDTAMASADDGLRDALDRAVAAEPLGVRVPIWWRAAGVLQWVFGALVVGGIAWYAVLALLDLLRFDTGDVARFGVVRTRSHDRRSILRRVRPVARAVAGVGARRRRRRIRRRLSDAVARRPGARHVGGGGIADHARVRELTRAALG